MYKTTCKKQVINVNNMIKEFVSPVSAVEHHPQTKKDNPPISPVTVFSHYSLF